MYWRADWCGVCHQKAPVVEEIAGAMGLPLEVLDWESEEGQTKAAGLRIKTVPTLALIDGSRVRFRLVGAMITPETVAQLAKASGIDARADGSGS